MPRTEGPDRVTAGALRPKRPQETAGIAPTATPFTLR